MNNKTVHKLLLSLILLILTSCGQGGGGNNSASVNTQAPAENDSSSDSSSDNTNQSTKPTQFSAASMKYKVKITFNNSTQSENLDNFPVMVKIPASSGIHAHIANTNASDVRFVDADETSELYHETEYYANAQDSIFWVKVPRIDAGSVTDHIWMYYGDSTRSSDERSDQVFHSSVFRAVFHFNNNFTGSTGETATDATGQEGIVTTLSNSLTSTSGILGPAINAANELSGFENSLSGALSEGTFTFWAKINSNYSGWRRLFSNEGASEDFYLAMANNTSSRILMFNAHIDGTRYQWRGSTPLSTNGSVWNHGAYAWKFTGTNFKPSLYVDGNLDTFTNDHDPGFIDGTFSTNDTPYTSMNRGASMSQRSITGDYDEVRLYRSKMSDDWIRAEYQSISGTLISLGSEINI